MTLVRRPILEEMGPVARHYGGAGHGLPIHKLRALVLLGGVVRPSRLSQAAQRSLLDLPLDRGYSVLEHWCEQARELAHHHHLDQLPVIVTIDPGSAEPVRPKGFPEVRVERDRHDYRGTGGSLHDLADEFEDDAYLLVASGSQVLLESLTQLSGALAARGGDVVLVAHRDGTPSNLMLVRCGCLRVLPSVGFVDMKEQALPAIAEKHRVNVLHISDPTGLPIRTRGDYINALRRFHQERQTQQRFRDPFAEEWQSVFTILESEAAFGTDTHFHDAVVLEGGRVEPGAIVARSVICPGGVARRGQICIDTVIAPADQMPGEGGVRGR